MTILQNGTLITPAGPQRADLLMDEGKIVQIAPHIDFLECEDTDEIFDASGCWVFPGFIDGHTHLDLNNGVMDTAGLPLTGVVLEDPNVTLAAAFEKPLLKYAPRCDAAKAFRKIARRLQGYPEPVSLR